MINYFEAAENSPRSRLARDGFRQSRAEKERILRYGAPSEYPSADMSKPYTGAKSVNDALVDCLELAEVMREIQITRDKVEEIDGVLAQMDESDARILRLWYIERKSKDEIAEAVCYASPTSIYDQRNKALVRFALLYFGAGLCRLCEALSRLFSCIEKRCMETCIFPVLSLRRKERSRETSPPCAPRFMREAFSLSTRRRSV